jgi:hypothetical protein
MTTEQSTTLEQKFSKLFQDGKLVQVHVSKWGMSYQIDEKDLELEEALPAFFKLGKKMLIDDDIRNQFTRIEARARNYLKDNSYKFPIADAHFVTHKKVICVYEELLKYKTEFDTATEKFIDNYEQHKTDMLAKFPNYKELLEPYYPPIQHIRDKFGFSISVFEVAFPKKLKSLSLEELQAKDESVKELKKKYEEQMEQQYNAAFIQMNEFVAESVKALRSQVVEVFDTIAQKIKNREVISSRNIQSVRTIVDEFEAMDFFDDAIVKEKLAVVKALVNEDHDFKDNFKVINKLQTALTEVLISTKDMSDIDKITGNYFRKIDLDDDI